MTQFDVFNAIPVAKIQIALITKVAILNLSTTAPAVVKVN